MTNNPFAGVRFACDDPEIQRLEEIQRRREFWMRVARQQNQQSYVNILLGRKS